MEKPIAPGFECCHPGPISVAGTVPCRKSLCTSTAMARAARAGIMIDSEMQPRRPGGQADEPDEPARLSCAQEVQVCKKRVGSRSGEAGPAGMCLGGQETAALTAAQSSLCLLMFMPKERIENNEYGCARAGAVTRARDRDPTRARLQQAHAAASGV